MERDHVLKKPIFSAAWNLYLNPVSTDCNFPPLHFSFFEMSGIQADLLSNHIQIESSKGQRGLLLTQQCYRHIPPPSSRKSH